MKLKELIEMAREYNISPDTELMVRPMAKDAPRKVTRVVIGANRMTLTCPGSRPLSRKYAFG